MAILSSGNRRVSIFVVVIALALFSQPLFSQNVCPPPPNEDGSSNWVSTFVPLEASEHLVYSLAELSAGALEFRFRVNGTLHLTEVLDLAKMELPELADSAPDAPALPAGFARGRKGEGVVAPPQRRDALLGQRVVELLAFHPDTARELHRLVREGAAIEIDVLRDGSLRDTISFAKLLSHSAELREAALAPLFVPSSVSGPGMVPGTRRLRVATNEYLESCSDCTSNHPCDTECGYDPGKGGPTTCGEYGAPCEPWCAPSFTSGEWWTSWTLYSSGYSGGQCLDTFFGLRWHNRRVTTYRRERIRRTTTCPNSPSCTGCYDTESVIDVQYSTLYCYEETASSCAIGQAPCCSTCSVYGWSECSNTFPCF
jgi:hypothetical protein